MCNYVAPVAEWGRLLQLLQELNSYEAYQRIFSSLYCVALALHIVYCLAVIFQSSLMSMGVRAASALRIVNAAARDTRSTRLGHMGEGHVSPLFSTPQWKQKQQNPPHPPPPVPWSVVS